TLLNLAMNAHNRGDAAASRRYAAESLKSMAAHALEEASKSSISDLLRAFSSMNTCLAEVIATASATERASDVIYDQVLSSKGEAFRLTSRRWRTLSESLDPETRATLDRLKTVRAAISNLFSVRELKDREQHERDIALLRTER